MSWLSGYQYRQKLVLKRADGAQTDYQMKLTMHKGTGTSAGAVCYLGNKAESWAASIPHDVRFTTAGGETQLKYWIETSDTSSATIWIKFDSIGTTDTDFYIYYGKESETTTSSGEDTFIFFDDFESGDLDKWDTKTFAISTTAYQGTYSAYGETTVTGEIKYLSKSITACRKARYIVWARFSVTNKDAFYIFHRPSYVLAAQSGYFRYYDGSWKNLPTSTSFAANTWYRCEATLNQDTKKYKVYINGSYKGEITTVLTGSDQTGTRHASSYAASQTNGWIDNSIVAKFDDPEPTYESWGSEETPVTTKRGAFFMVM